MLKIGKMQQALHSFEAWFERQKRVLPWRDEPTLYRVWISEIMLQQTQVITVIPFFERFIAKFPTLRSLAEASEEDVLLSWAGLGYYSRARNLHRAAKQIFNDLGGKFPTTREGWVSLPGIGDYTAGAILSIALNQPEAILDGNVERVLSRIRRVNRAKGDAAFKARLWKLSRIFVEESFRIGLKPSRINQALMELGAMICTPKKPKCLLCPLSDICRARMMGDQETFPPRKKPKDWIQVQEQVHCVIDPSGRVLVQVRSPGAWRAGLWDLPENLPSEKLSLEEVGTIETKHVVTRHKILRTTRVWKIRERAQLTASDSALIPGVRWISVSQDEKLDQIPLGSAFKRTMSTILERFPEVLPKSSALEPGSFG